MDITTTQYSTSILKKVEEGMSKTMEDMKFFINVKEENITPEEMVHKWELQERLDALKLIKSELIRENGKVKKTDAKYLMEEENEVTLLIRLKRAHEESMKGYEKANRKDLYDHEKAELDVILEFLPNLPTDEEIISYTKEVISELLATKEDGYKVSPRDMGFVVPKVKAKYPFVDNNIVKDVLIGNKN